MSAAPRDRTTSVVSVQMPADAGYVATLRLTAASLAARCELTIDDIEDLRLAVDEACALLLAHAVPGSTLDARFELSFACLLVEVSTVTLGGAGPDRGGLGWAVLSALASSVEVSSADTTLTIAVSKQREASTL